jgi:hypothetical protein
MTHKMVIGDIQIRCLRSFWDREIRELTDVLIDCVEGGASVSFMLPLSPIKAESFWRDSAACAERGERFVLVAEDGSGSIGSNRDRTTGNTRSPG